MFAGDLVLVVLEVALFAEVGAFGETVVGGHHVLAALADHFLNRTRATLNFYSWVLVNENWMM